MQGTGSLAVSGKTPAADFFRKGAAWDAHSSTAARIYLISRDPGDVDRGGGLQRRLPESADPFGHELSGNGFLFCRGTAAVAARAGGRRGGAGRGEGGFVPAPGNGRGDGADGAPAGVSAAVALYRFRRVPGRRRNAPGLPARTAPGLRGGVFPLPPHAGRGGRGPFRHGAAAHRQFVPGRKRRGGPVADPAGRRGGGL